MTDAAPQSPAPLDPARFAEICESLRTVIRRGVELRGLAFSIAAGPMLLLIWGRLSRFARRFRRLSERLAAGTLKPPHPRLSQSRKARAQPEASQPASQESGPPSPAPPPAGPPPPRMPRQRLWPVRVMQDLAVGGSWLRRLLADPGTEALVAAAPQTGRLLRPLCHMFGVELPPWLRLPRHSKPARTTPRAKVTARAARPAPPTPGNAPPAPPRSAPRSAPWPATQARAHGPPDTG